MQMLVKWLPSVSPSAVTQRISVVTSEGTLVSASIPDNVTSEFLVNNVPEDTELTVSLVAVSTTGKESAPATLTVRTPVVVPDAPTNLTVEFLS